ncbi:MAG: cysteine desulfurase [Candidatus Magasanikbacteria bacterium]|nr:cysteine desulfurase [Candidatus Magasanikbacteria bacterium]
MSLNLQKDFPILKRRVHGKKLVYLDNAATSQKPKVVMDILQKFYTTMNANIHRGVHTLSEESTAAYEAVREKTAKFIGAKSAGEIVFTKNATESINCVAVSWAKKNIKKGDEIIVSALEHHANLVPWQEFCRETGAALKIIPLTADFLLDLEGFEKLLNLNTKLVCVTGMSNVTGSIVPLKQITEMSRAVGAKVLIDAAQSIVHMATNVSDIGCDFLVFSSHKMLGPMGVGVLYIKESLIGQMSPYMYGGDMIETVEQYSSKYKMDYAKFEAGTQNVADVIAFGAALDYLKKVGMNAIEKHDRELFAYAKEKFGKFKTVKIFSPNNIKNCGPVLSFVVDGVHPHDIASIFDSEGVAIRAGFHCAEPLVRRLGVSSTARMSFYLYNTKADVDTAVKALQKVLKIFKVKN